MYNRYIPQPDGSYRRSRMQEAQNFSPAPPPRREPCLPEVEAMPIRPQQPEACAPEKPKPSPPQKRPMNQRSRQRPAPCPPPRQNSRPPRQEPCAEQRDNSVGGFLRQLLPQNFDTQDLLVVILLLLMAGDSSEDNNSALLTLALYLFM